jgi:Flp pilus assembly CpaF family ATPase
MLFLNSFGNEERIVLIEDKSEIQIEKDNLVRLEARREQTVLRAVTIRDLLKVTLRLRPDRIILGEVGARPLTFSKL